MARDIKKELIEKAKVFNTSDDIPNATKGLIALQKEWKSAKNAGKYERRLWEDFRKVCDEFFGRKQEISSELQKTLEANLDAKRK